MRKVLPQNLRVRQGLAALGVVSATYWATRALRKSRPPARGGADESEGAGRLRERLAAQSRELLRLDHEMRTPIGAALAALEILRSATDDDDLQTEAQRVIARQLARMTALTEELRELAQR
jgi:signal transduction histidine kinase